MPQTSHQYVIPAAHINEEGKLAGFVHSFDIGSAVDGPGIRFTLFVSGCQFHCLYCHNPDTWHLHTGQLMSVENVLEELKKYAHFLKFSGGLTISGGEPLVQSYFVGEIFRRAKHELNLHTALDTQGFLATHLPDEWFEAVDLVLLDIKHMNPDKHKALTGQVLQPTLDFARRLSDMGKKMWIRYVLVPGYTDDSSDVEQLANFLSTLNGIERVEVLPFHKMGEYKWYELGLDYQLSGVEPPTQESINWVSRQLARSA